LSRSGVVRGAADAVAPAPGAKIAKAFEKFLDRGA